LSDIVTVIAASVPLVRRGSLHFGKCPFHAGGDEKTGSLVVYTKPTRAKKPFFRCFGCGETGDIFDWVMKLKGMTFTEARKFLGSPDYKKSTRAEKLAREEASRQRLDRAHQKTLWLRRMDKAYGHTAGDYLADQGMSLRELRELFSWLPDWREWLATKPRQ